MTIQISVVVWTLLCFVLLMLILHFWLFKPVLRVMDARRERIERAAKKKADQEKRSEEYAAMLIEKKFAFDAERKQRQKAEIEAVRANGKKEIAAAQEARLREADACRAKAEATRTEILDTLSVHAAELAAAFANRVIKE